MRKIDVHAWIQEDSKLEYTPIEQDIVDWQLQFTSEGIVWGVSEHTPIIIEG